MKLPDSWRCESEKIMVVGASGVFVCTELLRVFNSQVNLIVTDYKTDRGNRLVELLNGDVSFQYIDVTDEENINATMKNIDLVVVTLKQNHPYIQQACLKNDILCIDVTPFASFVEKIEMLHGNNKKQQEASVVMSGFFPGLSGLMVKKAVSQFSDVHEVNVGLLQNTNAKAGITGVIDMLKIISERVHYCEDSKFIDLSGFTLKRQMYFCDSNNHSEVRLINHDEKIYIQRALKINNVNYWTSWNNSFFNKLISMLKHFGLIQFLNKFKNKKFLSNIVKYKPNKNENAFLTVEVTGMMAGKCCTKILSIATFSDYHFTAMFISALAKVSINKKMEGVVSPFEITDLDEILSELDCNAVVLEEFIQKLDTPNKMYVHGK